MKILISKPPYSIFGIVSEKNDTIPKFFVDTLFNVWYNKGTVKDKE